MRRPDPSPQPLYPTAAHPRHPGRRLDPGARHGRTGPTHPPRRRHGVVRPDRPALRRTTALAHAALRRTRRRSICRRSGDGRVGALRPPPASRTHPLPSPDARPSFASGRSCSPRNPAVTHHVVEILLTRPVTHSELRRASRALPLGANSDGTRLMAVHPAKTPGRALRSVRRRLQHLLPLDILTTHYPDPSGQVILNVEFGPAPWRLIGVAVAARGQRPAEYVGQCMTEALRHSEQRRARALTAQLRGHAGAPPSGRGPGLLGTHPAPPPLSRQQGSRSAGCNRVEQPNLHYLALPGALVAHAH